MRKTVPPAQRQTLPSAPLPSHLELVVPTAEVDAGMQPTTSVADTAAVVVYRELRRKILAGELAPDQRLRVSEVAQRHSCGVIPTREALNRLAAESLVAYSQQRGFAVAPISLESLHDLTRARSWISEVALREAVLRGDDAWEERVLLSLHRLNKVSRYLSVEPPVSNPAYEAPHRAFHLALFSGCGSVWMLDICERLFDHAERHRNLSRKVAVMPRENEHKEIVDAALGRRVDQAVALMKRHVELTADIIDAANPITE